MGFATDCIHAGQQPDPTTGAVSVPIYQTSTYVQEGIGQHKGYEYARTHNLTRRSLEKNLAALEGGADAYCFASGMAATQAVLTLVKGGSRVVVCDNVYGGTHRLFTKILANYGVEFAFLDATDPQAFAAEAGRFDMLWLESPTNPMMKICDIRALAELAKKQGAILVVDNTFMSPYFQKPIALGADIVVHSTTKFLNGHSDSVGGAAIVKHEKHAQWLQYVQNAIGAILSPFDSWLDAARHEDAAHADAPPRGQRLPGGSLPLQPQEGRAGAVARVPGPSRPPDPQAPGDGLRRARLVRPRQPGGGEEGPRAGAPVLARREPRRRRDARSRTPPR